MARGLECNAFARPACTVGRHVFQGAVEGVDAQVALDPFEEGLDLLAELVELGDLQGWKREVVDQEHGPGPRLGFEVTDPPQEIRVELRRLGPSEHNSLIAAQAGVRVDWPRRAEGRARCFADPWARWGWRKWTLSLYHVRWPVFLRWLGFPS